MGLGLPVVTSSDFDRTPVVRYDGRAGRIFRDDREQIDGKWEKKTTEITPDFQAVFDLENIETGWIFFSDQGPRYETVKIGNPLPNRPSDNHKAGFRILMKLGKASGGDVRELMANAKVSIAGMDALYDAYLAEVGANAGKLPLVKLEGTTAVTTKGKDATGKDVSSTNYQPNWKIVRWMDRPAELGGAGGAAAEPEPVKAAPPPADEGDGESF